MINVTTTELRIDLEKMMMHHSLWLIKVTIFVGGGVSLSKLKETGFTLMVINL